MLTAMLTAIISMAIISMAIILLTAIYSLNADFASWLLSIGFRFEKILMHKSLRADFFNAETKTWRFGFCVSPTVDRNYPVFFNAEIASC